jgi:5-hydroxyisourate hydrolase-like protein (transthyretin family)
MILSELSAVVQLIDGFNRQPAVGAAPIFLLDSKVCRPLLKPQAFYAFSDLEKGEYQLSIENEIFFSQQIVLNVPMALPLAEGIIPCTLQPNPLYPYPIGSTVLRGLIRQTGNGQPLAGVTVVADYRNKQDKALQQQTLSFNRGNYNGRYAVALRGKLAATTEVTLHFSKTGYADVSMQCSIASGAIQFVDIQMQPH